MSTQRNVMANMKAFADLKRNSFDLTNGHYYSQKCGEIIPIKAFHTLPGDYLDVSMTDKNLSFPMNTAAFLHARKEITVYHVPYNHVFSLFNQLQATRPDPKTSALAVSTKINEPRMKLLDLYHNCLLQFYFYAYITHILPQFLRSTIDGQYSGWKDFIYGTGQFELCYEAAKNELYRTDCNYQFNAFATPNLTFDFDFYDRAGGIHTTSFTVPVLSVSYIYSQFPFLPPSNFVDLKEFERQEDYYYANFLLDIEGRLRCFSWVRKLDMLGYGNLYPLFKMYESKIAEFEIFRESQPYSAFEAFWEKTFKMLQSQIINLATSYLSVSESDVSATPLYVNLYSILAYNKVFYDYFRNTYYDLDYNSRNYNIDFCAPYSENQNFPVLYCMDMDVRFLDIEYHQWKKDIVTGVLPEAQYGAVAGLSMSVNLSSVVGSTNSIEYPSPTADNATVLKPSFNTAQQGYLYSLSGDLSANPSPGVSTYYQARTPHSHSVSLSGSGGTVSFDVLSLKRAEMLQDYRQMLMRNGNRTIDIFKGLYGDNPASEDDNSPRFVDAFGSTLFVDTIVSTADTAQQDSNKGALGDLGARAVINSGGNFKFKTSDFGVLLFVGYIVPDAVYPSFGIDSANRFLDPESHFIPFFQNLGFQPIHNFMRNIYYTTSSWKLAVRGFAPSYVNFKTDVDTCHGSFVRLPASNVLQKFKAPQESEITYPLDDFVGSFNHWVPSRTDVLLSAYTSLKHLYISPSYWDNVFIQKADADFESDHFIVDTHIFIKAVRKLSKLGLPNF